MGGINTDMGLVELGESLTKLGLLDLGIFDSRMHFRSAVVIAFAALAEAAPTTTVKASPDAGSPSKDVYPPSGSTFHLVVHLRGV